MSNCPQCNSQNPPGAAFCDNCGASLAGVAPPQPAAPVAPAMSPAPAAGTACPSCGTPAIPGEAFCGNCGAALSAVQPAAAPPAAPFQPVAPAPAPAAPVGATVRCPACGTDNMPGQAFCDNCGASLTAAPAPVVQPPVIPVAPPVAPPVWGRPRLVVVGTGAEFDLSGKAEIIIGREDPVSGVFPEVDLTPHGGEEGGVSRRHAKLTARGNQWLIEDLNSVNFTFVNNQKLNPGVPQPLNNGDQVRLGRVLMTFHTA